LEIDPHHVLAAEVSVSTGLRVKRAVGLPLSPEVMREGEVVDVDALAGTLKELFETHKIDRRVRVGVANQRVMVRTIELPVIENPRELEAAVRFRAQDEIPMPMDEVVLDFHPRPVMATDAGPRQRVVVVAARREMVEKLLSAVSAAGLRVEGIDLSAFALIRALAPAGSSDRVLYVALGGQTNLAVAEGRDCVFTRILGAGLDMIVNATAERAGVSRLEARRLLHDGAEPGEEQEEPGTQILRAVLDEVVRTMVSEIRSSLDYQLSQDADGPVSRAVLLGPGAELGALTERLTEELGLPVSLGEVQLADPAVVTDIPLSRLAVAAGLAVSEAPR
jgi:type IV pilus assembly protein PilM